MIVETATILGIKLEDCQVNNDNIGEARLIYINASGHTCHAQTDGKCCGKEVVVLVILGNKGELLCNQHGHGVIALYNKALRQSAVLKS